jgi:hypothetical protein
MGGTWQVANARGEDNKDLTGRVYKARHVLSKGWEWAAAMLTTTHEKEQGQHQISKH